MPVSNDWAVAIRAPWHWPFELPGIGRKSANVILREAGVPAEGVIVDLHVNQTQTSVDGFVWREGYCKNLPQTLRK